jgi:hypothetical protein
MARGLLFALENVLWRTVDQDRRVSANVACAAATPEPGRMT